MSCDPANKIGWLEFVRSPPFQTPFHFMVYCSMQEGERFWLCGGLLRMISSMIALQVPVANPIRPTPLMITFFVITNGESPSVWKVSISSNGGKISARKLLLTEPTNEITRSSSGISTARQPGLQREGGLFGPA